VLRERDTTANGRLEETLYAIHDGNWNVVANTSGSVVERFHCDPYGKTSVLEADFIADGDRLTDFDWEFRSTCREFDSETQLFTTGRDIIMQGLYDSAPETRSGISTGKASTRTTF